MFKRRFFLAVAALALLCLGLVCACSTSRETQSDSTLNSNASVEERLASMTLEEKVAQLFIVEPSALEGLAGNGDPLERYPVAGFIYFQSSLQNPDQTRTMLASTQQRMRDVTGLPAFLCVDEEGGEVARIANNEAFGVADVGDMHDVGASGDANLARSYAKRIGGYLTDLGFNVDFAPVADLASSEDDAMYERSFGPDPNKTAAMVKAQVEGFAEAGVLCSAKHFPGIGGVSGDSHEEAITSNASLDSFRKTALVPFKAAIEADVPFIMVGHLSTPAATGNNAPATVSHLWLTDILRNELGYDGVIITDSLIMGALSSEYSQRELGVLAIEAGTDVLLHPSDFEAMYQGVLDAVKSGRISERRIDESVERILRLKLSRLS